MRLGRVSTQDELLLQAALGNDGTARDAWLRVARGLNLDLLPSESHAILPLLAVNLPRLGYRYADQRRLDGVRKRTWYMNTQSVRVAGQVIERLGASGVSPVVTGALGVVLQVGDLSVRQVPTVDLAILPGHREAASRVLSDAGWRLDGVRHDGCFLDIHAEVWSRAGADSVTVRWGDDIWPFDADVAGCELPYAGMCDVIVRVAQTADLLAYVLVDFPTMPGYWHTRLLVDSHLLASRLTPGDWQRFLACVNHRKGALTARETLSYLATALEAPVPDYVLAGLAAQRASTSDRLAFRVSPRSAVIAAYLRRRGVDELRYGVAGVPAFLQDVWDVDRRMQLASAGLRRIRRRMSTVT